MCLDNRLGRVYDSGMNKLYAIADYDYHSIQHGVTPPPAHEREPEWVTPWDYVEITDTELGGTCIEFSP